MRYTHLITLACDGDLRPNYGRENLAIEDMLYAYSLVKENDLVQQVEIH